MHAAFASARRISFSSDSQAFHLVSIGFRCIGEKLPESRNCIIIYSPKLTGLAQLRLGMRHPNSSPLDFTVIHSNMAITTWQASLGDSDSPMLDASLPILKGKEDRTKLDHSI